MHEGLENEGGRATGRHRWRLAQTLLALLLAGLIGVPAALAEEDVTEAMDREHRGDAPVPGAAAGVAEELPGETVAYGRAADASPLVGYTAGPADPKAPGLIVIHEWWGLNDNIREMTRRLAALGYRALAVDLYAGASATSPGGARDLMRAAMDDPEAARANLRQAHAWLVGAGAPRTGSVGWCFGGGWSLETALLLPGQLDAAVIYYGRLETDRDRLARLETPVLGIFGELDRAIPVDAVRGFERTLQQLGKQVEVHVYPRADHAFANPSGTRYEARAAADAWSKTRLFLARHLQPTGAL